MRGNMDKYNVVLIPRLWKSFKALEIESNLVSYENYYRALATWIINHKKLIGDKILNDFRLDILIELDPTKYVIENMGDNGVSLKMEHNRMFGGEKPKHLEMLIQTIANTLWDLATMYSGLNCPDCIYDDGLRYVIIEDENSKERNFALSCESCGHLQKFDGEILSRERVKIIPANKEDIAKHNA